jgi:hypothetical protein
VGRGRVRRGEAALGALLVAGLLLAGCGRAKTLTATEFIDQINSEGVSIKLGRQLTSGGGAKEIYAVSLPPLPGEPPPAKGGEGDRGSGGTLYAFDGTGDANDQYDACRGSGGLLCYQASNIVVVLDDEGSGLEARRLSVAVQRLASE